MVHSLDQNFFVLYNELHNATIRLFTEIIRHFEYAAEPSSTVEEQLKIILDKYNELMKQNKEIRTEFSKSGMDIRESWLAAKHVNDQAKSVPQSTKKSVAHDHHLAEQKNMSRSPKQTKLKPQLKDSSLTCNSQRQSKVEDDFNHSEIRQSNAGDLNEEKSRPFLTQKGPEMNLQSIPQKDSSVKIQPRESNLQLTSQNSKMNNEDLDDLNNTPSRTNRNSNLTNKSQTPNRSASHRLTDLQDREFRLMEERFSKQTGRETNLSQHKHSEESTQVTPGVKNQHSTLVKDFKVSQEIPAQISFATEIANRPLSFSKASNGRNRESDLERYLKVRSSNLSRETKINVHHLNLPEIVREETESIFGEIPNLDQIQTDLKLTQSQMLSSTPKDSETRTHIINKYKPSKVITLNQLKTFTSEFYSAKLEYDSKCSQTKSPKGTPEEFLLMYLKQKYGLNELIQAWAFTIVDGLKTHANSDVEVAILLHVK
jgi:hypothetical protein